MRVKFSLAREAVILSDAREVIQVWHAPFFDKPAALKPQASMAELQAEARAQGFQAGKEEGMERGIAEARAIVERMSAVADQLAQPFRNLDTMVTKELAGMAVLLAKQIVRRELAINSAGVTEIVAQALSTLYKLDGEVVIFLNPVDAAHMRELAETPDVLEGKTWKIVEDSALSPGGCQVKTPTSFVDASVEKQMDLVFSELIESCQNMSES